MKKLIKRLRKAFAIFFVSNRISPEKLEKSNIELWKLRCRSFYMTGGDDMVGRCQDFEKRWKELVPKYNC